MAYWSSDIGGWQDLPAKPDKPPRKPLLRAEDAKKVIGEYRDYPELYVRWFQYACFCPTFRALGSRPENEVWSYGAEAEPILVKYLRLRYRLLPYIYSLACRTWQTGAPFMRALFMDFPHDRAVADIRDEFMFGPAFLVAPVVEQGRTRRRVYLPAGTAWIDYWSHERHAGGQTIVAAAPIDTIPLFVREGAIVPHGEDIQHTRQKQVRIELRVYEGADGRFNLYRDDGVTYRYEQGDYTLIRIRWDDARKQIHVEGDSEGLFAGPEGEWLKRISSQEGKTGAS